MTNWRYKQRRDSKFQNKHKGSVRNQMLRTHKKRSKEVQRFVTDAEFRGRYGYTRVYYDKNRNEYVVKLWQHGVRVSHADYFTEDKQDALDTAKRMTEEERYASF